MNLKNSPKSPNNELDTVDRKSPNEEEKDNCDKHLQKLNMHMNLRNDINLVRNCLQNLMRMERKSIDSIFRGKVDKHERIMMK